VMADDGGHAHVTRAWPRHHVQLAVDDLALHVRRQSFELGHELRVGSARLRGLAHADECISRDDLGPGLGSARNVGAVKLLRAARGSETADHRRMNADRKLRLHSLDGFASALLLALGAAPLVACGGGVTVEDDGAGGSNGDGGAGNGSVAGNTGNGPATGPAGTGGMGGGTTSGGTSGSNVTTGSSGGGTSSVAASTGQASTGTGVGGGSGGCVNPTPYIVDGIDTGFDTCDGGNLRRREQLRCPESTEEPNSCCGECEEGFFCSESGEAGCSCVPICHTDDDCADGNLCMCGRYGGQCVPATCQTGSDCGAGQECTSWDTTQGCLYPAFACTTPQDSCGGDLDCEEPGLRYCTLQEDGHRECQDGGCAIGRPFLVDDCARTAGLAARSDWSDPALHPAIADHDATLRAMLAEAWEHVALMEHASIAAFARFAMQLLALGAPPELLVRTHDAMRDETKHARLAFALASAYRGAPVGPGRLALDGALGGDVDVIDFVKLTIREGCVGETVAALEAGEGEAVALDPKVREVLGTIAVDERAHAELAWSTVRWALDTFGDDVRAAIDAEIATLEDELAIGGEVVVDDADRELARHGVTTSVARAALRRETLRKVVLPCLRALTTPRRDVASAPGALHAAI
jgi:hypothetical protein